MKLTAVLLTAFSATASAGTLWSGTQRVFGNPPAGPPVPGKSPLLYCASHTEDDILKITNVDISPNPPVPGEKLIIKAKGYLKQSIEEGAYVNVEVKYGFVKLLHQTLDLCENADQIGEKCPVEAGEMEITKEVQLPKPIPPGKYHVLADVYNYDDEPITCILADVVFFKQ